MCAAGPPIASVPSRRNSAASSQSASLREVVASGIDSSIRSSRVAKVLERAVFVIENRGPGQFACNFSKVSTFYRYVISPRSPSTDLVDEEDPPISRQKPYVLSTQSSNHSYPLFAGHSPFAGHVVCTLRACPERAMVRLKQELGGRDDDGVTT
jgi:hypothetical protein